MPHECAHVNLDVHPKDLEFDGSGWHIPRPDKVNRPPRLEGI